MFLHDWEVTGLSGMLEDFRISESEVEGVKILFATYGQAYGYDGDAFVLFRRDGKLFEVNASHCSCYGLEGRWEPEETSVDALRMRLEQGSLGQSGDHNFRDELAAVLLALS